MKAAKRERTKYLAFLFVIGFFFTFFFFSAIEHNYSIEGNVVQQDGEILEIKDVAGETWLFITKEKFSKYESIKVYFFDNTTSFNRDDDTIIKVKRKR